MDQLEHLAHCPSRSLAAEPKLNHILLWPLCSLTICSLTPSFQLISSHKIIQVLQFNLHPWIVLNSRRRPRAGLPAAYRRCIVTNRKMDINTGSRGPFVPKIKPVQKIRDKSPPPLVPVPYKPILKEPPRWLPGEYRARDLWYRFVTRTGTKGWLQCRSREFRV
jgi:hypothetical protein